VRTLLLPAFAEGSFNKSIEAEVAHCIFQSKTFIFLVKIMFRCRSFRLRRSHMSWVSGFFILALLRKLQCLSDDLL
jgi:hypothetical protein